MSKLCDYAMLRALLSIYSLLSGRLLRWPDLDADQRNWNSDHINEQLHCEQRNSRFDRCSILHGRTRKFSFPEDEPDHERDFWMGRGFVCH